MHKTTLEQWALLELVIELGSFAKAAEASFRSQSSVSYNLALLQERLGVSLLKPEGRKAVLTPEGELLLAQVRPLLKSFHYVESRAATLKNGIRTRIDLVVDCIFPRARLFAILHQFQRLHASTQVHLTEILETDTADLAEADVMVLTRRQDLTGRGQWLRNVDFVAVAHRDHPLHQLPAPLEEADLANYPLIRLAGQNSSESSPTADWTFSTLDAACEAVTWQVGQRVGVGRLGGHCNECDACRRGEFTLCSHQPVVGSSQDGGYAEMMLAKATGLVAIPDALSAVDAAPLLCAGIATFNAVRKSGAQPGDSIVVLGIGGLGHLAVQYAAKMGFRVIAIGRGSDKPPAVLALGARDYLDSSLDNPAEALRKLGGVKAIVTTVTDNAIASSLLPALQPKGKLMVLGVGQQPLVLSPGMLVGRELSIEGSLTGTPNETESTLRFSLLNNVQPMTEIFPLAQANEAWQKMKSGKARFRIVLTM